MSELIEDLMMLADKCSEDDPADELGLLLVRAVGQIRGDAYAIATKDARIAELEQLLRYVRESAIYDNTVQAECIDDALSGNQSKPKGCTKLGCFPYCDCDGVDGHVPATPSEDGPEEMQFAYLHPNGERHTVTVSREEVLREMPDFLFEKLCGNFCQCEPVGETNVVECNCDEYAEEFQLLAAEPNAVTKEVAEFRAQHSRIVAEKDAEISKRDQAFDVMNRTLNAVIEERDELRTQLDAQPARQVGGDELARKADLLDQYANEAEAAGFAGVGEWLDALQESLRLVTLARDAFDKRLTEWQQIAETEAENRMADSAALAPAAVVMPERKPIEYGKWRPVGVYEGFNAALDEVARLNRNPIPVELLKSLSKSACKLINEVREFNVSGVYFTEIGENLQTLTSLELENDELRALLGKESE